MDPVAGGVLQQTAGKLDSLRRCLWLEDLGTCRNQETTMNEHRYNRNNLTFHRIQGTQSTYTYVYNSYTCIIMHTYVHSNNKILEEICIHTYIRAYNPTFYCRHWDICTNIRTYLIPRVWFDLGEFEFSVVRVHLLDLFSGGRAQHLDDLHQLIYTTVSREDWRT